MNFSKIESEPKLHADPQAHPVALDTAYRHAAAGGHLGDAEAGTALPAASGPGDDAVPTLPVLASGAHLVGPDLGRTGYQVVRTRKVSRAEPGR